MTDGAGAPFELPELVAALRHDPSSRRTLVAAGSAVVAPRNNGVVVAVTPGSTASPTASAHVSSLGRIAT